MNNATAEQPTPRSNDPIHELTELVITRFDHVDRELNEVTTELRSIRRDVNDLAERARNTAGYSKEIDALMERINRIEAHLSLN